MMALAADDIADLRRWAICGAVIVLAHGGLAAGIINWGEPIEGTGAAAGIVIQAAGVDENTIVVDRGQLMAGRQLDVTRRLDEQKSRGGR